MKSLFISTLLVFQFNLGFSQFDTPTKNFTPLNNFFTNASCFQVVNQDSIPLADVNLEFNGKTTKTDVEGCAKIPANLSEIKISKPGYAPLHLKGKTIPQTWQVSINENPDFPELEEISGSMSPFSSLKNYDGIIDLGLAISSLKFTDLFNFTPSQFISPYMETINVFGSREIPSNIFLPKQSESYFISVNFKKENYKLLLPKSSSYHLTGIYAQAPMKDIMDYAQGKSSPDKLFNSLKILSSGFTGNFSAPQTKQDITFNVKGKSLLDVENNPPQNYTPLNLSFARMDDHLIPIDLNMKSGKTKINTDTNGIIVQGALYLKNNEATEGMFARYPLTYESSLEVKLESWDSLSIKTNEQYVAINFYKFQTRKNPTYKFDETNLQNTSSVIGTRDELSAYTIDPALDYDFYLVIDFSLDPGTGKIEDLNNTEKNLSKVSYKKF